MSSGFGSDDDDLHVQSMTSRGRDWPCLRQFVVFLENRVGGLHDLLRTVERDDLKIVAMSVLESSDCALVRMIADHYERARELLHLSGVSFIETDIIGVLLPDTDQPHTKLLGSLMSAELNVQYVYPMLYQRNGRGAVAVCATDVDETLRVLGEASLDLVNEDDLMEFGDSY